MITELTPADVNLLQVVGSNPGTTWISKVNAATANLVRLGLIYRPESGYARITDAGKEVLAKMKGAK